MHPDINLLGITCVDGNTNVDQVVANTFKVLDAAGAGDIPVARGAVRPLLGKSQYAEYVHGKDGMCDLGIAPSNRKVDPRSAVELLRDLIESSQDGQEVHLSRSEFLRQSQYVDLDHGLNPSSHCQPRQLLEHSYR